MNRGGNRGYGRGGFAPKRMVYEEAPSFGYQDKMRAFQEQSRGQRGKPIARSNPQRSQSSRQFQERKESTFREKKGTEVTEVVVEDFKKNLLAGFDNLEEVIKAKKFQTTERAVPIPVSTRGVGFSVQETFTRVTAIEENVRRH